MFTKEQRESRRRQLSGGSALRHATVMLLALSDDELTGASVEDRATLLEVVTDAEERLASAGKPETPTQEQVEKRTVERLANFTRELEAGAWQRQQRAAWQRRQRDLDRGTGRTTALILHAIGEAVAFPGKWVEFVDHAPFRPELADAVGKMANYLALRIVVVVVRPTIGSPYTRKILLLSDPRQKAKVCRGSRIWMDNGERVVVLSAHHGRYAVR